MSWSEGRESSTSGESRFWSKEKIAEKVKHVNAVLTQLSLDEDFQDDLQLGAVKVAIDHWTGKRRLPPKEAAQLQNHRRVMYVFQRFSVLTEVCKAARMGVLLDHLLQRLPALKQEVIINTFREDLKKIKAEGDSLKQQQQQQQQQQYFVSNSNKSSNSSNGNNSNGIGNLGSGTSVRDVVVSSSTADSAVDDNVATAAATTAAAADRSAQKKSTFFAAVFTLLMGMVIMTIAYGAIQANQQQSTAAGTGDNIAASSFYNHVTQQQQQQQNDEQEL